MRALVVYESMFGSTRMVAEAIAEGLGPKPDVTVAGVADATDTLDGFDLVIVGGPTQAWGMSWPSTRRGATLRTGQPGTDLVLEPGADTGPGVREWLASLSRADTRAAAFDTRIKAPVLFTGRASRTVRRHLVRLGLDVVAPPESFLVDNKSHLLPGELERARAWGATLATIIEGAGTRSV